MPVIKVQHSFQGTSNLPKDQFVNTFYFTGPRVVGEELRALVNAVKGFYADAPSGGGMPLTNFISGTAGGSGARVKVFSLDDPMPREPIFDEEYEPPNVNSSDTANLPTEVAVCLSYRAGGIIGVPPTSLRGRVYIGPLTVYAIESAAPSVEPRVKVNFQVSLVEAAGDMAGVAAGAGYGWAVFSQTRQVAAPIIECWVDDAFDTQRRRGVAALTRTIRSIGL